MTNADHSPPDPAPVAEIVTFRLKPGNDPAAFLDAARATIPAVAARPGFIRRCLSCDASGLWTDHVEWTDLPRARDAAASLMALPAFGAFVAAIDPEALAMRHAAILMTMGD